VVQRSFIFNVFPTYHGENFVRIQVKTHDFEANEWSNIITWMEPIVPGDINDVEDEETLWHAAQWARRIARLIEIEAVARAGKSARETDAPSGDTTGTLTPDV
jgi:hypothetical protein